MIINHEAPISTEQFHTLAERDLLLSDWQQDWRTHWKTLIVEGQPVTFQYHLDIDAYLERSSVDAPDVLLARAQALLAEHLQVATATRPVGAN